MSAEGTSTDALLAALAEEERRLREIDEERARTQTKVDALRLRIASAANAPSIPAAPPTATAPQSPRKKVRLFRSLFRGREDLYPPGFVSKKTGKAGYAPACANKFVSGLCGLPKIKCGDCTNQAFRPVDDQAVLDHLRGRHVMGVYARGEAPLGFAEAKPDLIV
jgi:hypothetical protein